MPRRFAPRNDRGGTSLHPQTRFCLLHVIANQCMGAPQRGTLCGERSPKGALPCSGLWPGLGMADFGATTWRTLGRRGAAIRVPCPGCPLRKRPYKRSHAPAFCMSLRTSAKWEPGRTCAARRRRCSGAAETWLFLRKSRGEGCAACIAEVWQSVIPQGNLARWYHFRQIRSSCVFAQSTTFRYVLPQELRIATSLRSSQWHAETWQVPASAAM